MLWNVGPFHECGKEHGLMPLPKFFFLFIEIFWNFFFKKVWWQWHHSFLHSSPHEIVTFGPTPHLIALHQWYYFLSFTISETYAVFKQALLGLVLFINEKCFIIFGQNFQFRVIVVPVYWLENCIHVNSNCCSHISWLSSVLGYLLLFSLSISSLHFSFLLVLAFF